MEVPGELADLVELNLPSHDRRIASVTLGEVTGP